MPDRPRILVTKRVFPEAIACLEREFAVDYSATDQVMDRGELAARARGCSAIVSQLTDKLDAALIDQLEGVRVIANVAVGYDNIDVKAATSRGIAVTNTPGVLTETTADFAFALLMAAARRIPEAHAFVHSGAWKTWIIDLLAGQDIHGAVLGIFGLGRIGAAVARRGRGFGMRVLYADAAAAPAALEQELDARRVSKEELLRESDFVSLHVPLTAQTRHLIGAAELRLMKPTSILINTSRGPVVDEAALADALQRRTIWAAGLDVFENEPAVDARLLGLPNVVLAPHIASASYATRRRMSMMAAGNAAAALKGQRPPNLVNPEVWR